MPSRKYQHIQVGSRFLKVGDSYGRTWEVIRLWTTGDGLPHALLESNDRERDTRIMSLSALIDDRLFVPAPPDSSR
jgi:hypothetical protein